MNKQTKPFPWKEVIFFLGGFMSCALYFRQSHDVRGVLIASILFGTVVTIVLVAIDTVIDTRNSFLAQGYAFSRAVGGVAGLIVFGAEMANTGYLGRASIVMVAIAILTFLTLVGILWILGAIATKLGL